MLSYSDRNRINELANKIRIALDISLPACPREAIEKLSGAIFNDITDFYVDAYIEKNAANDSFSIHLNQNRCYNREKFTLAHELGHLFLHMGYLIDQDKWNAIGDRQHYRDNTYSIDEYEANEFAASFLMPKREFLNVAERHLFENVYDVNRIANYFDVSEEAASIRGKLLGIFRW